ncbi:MAG: deoxyribonuclease I [Gammaproteobacteria bacterium]|nr:deoxyribonuclease I [Gammaproteobacteria bacterium]
MARPPSPKRPASTRTPARPAKRPAGRTTGRAGGLARWIPILRRGLTALRDVAIGLTLISAVSFLPASLDETWPEHARRALEITRDIRALLLEILRDAAAGSAALLARVDRDDGDAPAGVLAEPVSDENGRGITPSDASRSRHDGTPGIPASFSTARAALFDTVNGTDAVTFYCRCRFDRNGRTDLAGCGLGALRGSPRAERVEAEHVFPAAQFGQSRRCWREPAAFAACRNDGSLLSGRSCCERVDKTFAAAYKDLHNLVPAVGAINAARSNLAWGELRSGQQLGSCAMRFDPIMRRVQPPDAVRGDIARIMLYMHDTYGFRLSRQDRQLYAAWSNLDPPDAAEIERNRRIRRIQGRGNRYVETYRTP